MTSRYIYTPSGRGGNASPSADDAPFEEREIELHGKNGEANVPREAMKCLPKRGWLSRISLRVFGMY